MCTKRITYCCESWVLTKDIRSGIQAAEIKNKRDYEKIWSEKRSDETKNEIRTNIEENTNGNSNGLDI